MNRAVFSGGIARMREAAREIASNVHYMRGEMPQVAFPDDMRARMADVCSEIEEVLRDTQPEFDNLEDKLGLRPGLPPYDSGIVNPDPRVTMRFIREWLWNEIRPIDGVVRSLRAAAEKDAAAGLACILVSESAANILHAYTAITASLDVIARELAPPDGPEPCDLVDNERRSVLDPALIRAFRETNYEIDRGSHSIVLRIGEPNAEVAQLLAEAGATGAAFITAANPFSRNLTDADNARRNEILKTQALERWLSVLPAIGRATDGRWSEPSLLLIGSTVADANHLADIHQQNAYVWIDADGLPWLILRR